VPSGNPGGDCGRDGAARAAVAGGRRRADRWAPSVSDGKSGCGVTRAGLGETERGALGRVAEGGGRACGLGRARSLGRAREVGAADWVGFWLGFGLSGFSFLFFSF
jgi:hypothetical protein